MTAIQPDPGNLVSLRGREWVVLPGSTSERLRLRPLSGPESGATIILSALEPEAPKAARFPPPDPARLGTSGEALLLTDALRLALRQGAGPFRSAGRIAFQPRAYQLVPLIMALRLDPVRLLIADDVGIGKTIEAGLILREFRDRGEISGATILCPPHLVDQWVEELRDKFDLIAQPVTSASARRLERGLGLDESLFDHHPLTVVSLDYIKSERRRAEFRRKCPSFVIVDEAHACVGTGMKGASQRYGLLSDLAADAQRSLVMLTATPHSGDANAFDKLVGLIDPAFGDGLALQGEGRERLGRHFVQRRRIDVRDEGWGDDGAGDERVFPEHNTRDVPYRLDPDHLAFHDAVLDYCLGVTDAAGAEGRDRRLAFWGTLALMRCVGSSVPAALSTLRNRRSGAQDEDESLLEGVVFDADEDTLSDEDLEPAGIGQDTDRAALDALILQGETLLESGKDPKIARLVKELKPLLKAGSRPVVFCRFIATAESVGEALRQAFKKHHVAVVSGRLPGAERKVVVAETGEHDARILVATDCLSEGINLQTLYDAVLHYDLSWNPTRHQQREGRVDRFGQPAPVVHSLTMFAENSAIDGAVLQVILRKAEEIRKATGVSVGMPANREKISEALMQALILRRGRTEQLSFDLGPVSEGAVEDSIENVWRNAEENEKASRARFAQRRLKPAEVLPEWRRSNALLGSAEDVERFTRRALRHLGAPLGEAPNGHALSLDALPELLRETLRARGFTGKKRVVFDPTVPEGYVGLHRAHPIVAALSERLGEGALEARDGKDVLARAGAWRAEGLTQMTTLALLRIRHRIARRRAAEGDFLLAEEIAAVVFEGVSVEPAGFGASALSHLERLGKTLDDAVRERQVAAAIVRLTDDPDTFAAIARQRASELAADHDRLRAARGGEGASTRVDPVLPPDLIGVWVMLPEQTI